MIRLHDKEFVPFMSAATIQNRLDEICAELNKKYANSEQAPLFLAILNGSFMIASDVMRRMNVISEISFIKLKSYSGTESTGQVTTAIGLNPDKIKGRDIILLEDIVDTGNTLHYFLPQLQAMQPKSLCVVSLLLKPEALQHKDLQLDYIGFEIENKFIVGYGLDYNGLGRQFTDIYQLKD